MVAGHANTLQAQEESTGSHGEEHAHHKNSLALFLGAATHLGTDGHSNETGFAIGLEYARRVGSRVTIGVVGERASTDSKENYVLAVPLFVHLAESLAFVLAPGAEFATHEDHGHEEKETEFLMRFGTVYEIELHNWAIGPQVYGDLVGGDWTLGYGVSFGYLF